MLIINNRVLKFFQARKIFLSVFLSVLGLIGLSAINTGCIPTNPAETILTYYIVLPAIVAVLIVCAYLVLHYTKSSVVKYPRRFIWIGIIIWLSVICFVVIYNQVNPSGGVKISNTEINSTAPP